MIHDGDTSYEVDSAMKQIIATVIRKHGNAVQQVGRWGLVVDQIYASTKTPKPKKPRAPKPKAPPRAGADAVSNDEPEAESEQAERQGKPPHLQVLKWIKPPPGVQVHMKGAKLGKGLAHFLEVRTDLWVLMSDADREAAVMTKLLERDVTADDEGATRIRRTDLPIQTHPAVQEAYGPWWERMDPGAGPTVAPTGARGRARGDDDAGN